MNVPPPVPEPAPVERTQTVNPAEGSLAHAEVVVSWTATHCAAVELPVGQAATVGSELPEGSTVAVASDETNFHPKSIEIDRGLDGRAEPELL